MRLARSAETIRVSAEQRRQDQAAAVQVERQRLILAEERRQAAEQARTRRRFARRQARAARAAKVRSAVPTIGRRVMIVGPILAPMTVAWVGQIQFATGTLDWPLLAALVFAASWELTTAFAGWMFHRARSAGFGGSVYRAATWLFAASAGGMNYWHALDGGPVLQPTPKAVSYGAMSLVGIALWELYASLVQREALIAAGKLPPARPRFGVARWIRYPGITFTAWSLAIRDGLQTTEAAWSAARSTDGEGAPTGHATPAAQVTPEVTTQATDSDGGQVTPGHLTQVTLESATQVTPQVTPQVTSEATPESAPKSLAQATRKPSPKPVSKARRKPRRTDEELIAELEEIVAEHYQGGGGEIEVKPIAARLGIGRDRARKLLDQMNVRPIRKAVSQ